MRKPKLKATVLLLALVFDLLCVSPAQAQYSVEPQGSFFRGHLWLGEGAAGVFSSNKSAGHRFRLGFEAHLGDEYRYILGWTFFDRLFSGETSSSVGGISRRAVDLDFGYFVVPD